MTVRKLIFAPPPIGSTCRLLIFTLVWMLPGFLLQAQQENFFEEVDPDTLTLSESQQKVIDYANSLPYKDGLVVVRLADFWDYQDNGVIGFSIPDFDTQTHTFHAEEVNFTDTANFSWAGKKSEDGGDFVLYSSSDGKIGFIDLVTDFYSIFPLGEDLALILRHNMAEYPEMECAGVADTTESSILEYCEEDDCGSAVVDVLVLITDSAQVWINANFGVFGQAYLYFGTNSINEALFLSGVPNKVVRTRFVNNYDPSFDLNSDDYLTDLDELEVEQEQSGSLKFQYRADIVVMLTAIGYQNIAGVANTINPSAAAKYCIVEVPFLLDPRYTFAHEVAHTFGCDHDPDHASGIEEDCAHGHYLDLDTERPTIMSFIDAANNPAGRILRYSNPDVLFGGAATGVTDSRDNARIIRASLCEVASNLSSPELSVLVLGSPTLCGLNGSISNNTFYAQVLEPAPGFPGTPPYSYAWYWSPDGVFSPGNYLGSGSSVPINQVLNCPQFFLRVVVTSNDNVTVVSRAKKVSTALCTSCEESIGQIILGQHRRQTAALQWRLSPNPSADNITIDFMRSSSGPIIFRILDAQGMLLRMDQLDQSRRLVLDTAGLPTGVYFLQAVDGEQVSTQKFIIQK